MSLGSMKWAMTVLLLSLDGTLINWSLHDRKAQCDLKRFSLVVAILFLVLVSCDREGFSDIGKGYCYKLIAFEHSSENTQEGDLIIVDMADMDIPELCIATFISDANSRTLGYALRDRSEGDSLVLRMHEEAFHISPRDDHEDIPIRILKRIPKDQIKGEDLPLIYENACIYQFILDRGLKPFDIEQDGVFILSRSLVKAVGIKHGDEVRMHHVTTTLDGRELASSEKGIPLDFTVGQEYQVLPGVERAMKNLKYGQEIELIIPSYLAYGERGSGQGMVEPYTPIYMKLKFELLNRASP